MGLKKERSFVQILVQISADGQAISFPFSRRSFSGVSISRALRGRLLSLTVCDFTTFNSTEAQ